MTTNDSKWDLRFLRWINCSEGPRGWSKDPSRQVAAAIVKPNRRLVSIGYNGFATGVEDHRDRLENRDTKYELVVHAEDNALLTAERDVSGFTMYSTLMPCSRCAAKIINSGIKKVVCIDDNIICSPGDSKVRFDLSDIQFREAGVQVVKYMFYD